MNVVTAKLYCLLLVLAVVAGCTSVPGVDDRRTEYKKARVEPTLEVPPDLTSSSIEDAMEVPGAEEAEGTTFSDYSRGRTQPAAVSGQSVLPLQDNIRVERDGNQRWLVIQAEPGQTWSKVREFWLESGFLIKVEDPRVGIMETEWTENRADIPQDFIRSALKKAFDFMYSAATRDKYRVRLERGSEAGSTELYLTHYGMEEVVTETAAGETTSTVWKPRPSDPELEVEMLNRMMAFFGVEKEEAERLLAKGKQKPPRARLVREEDGTAMLLVAEAFSRAWRLTGLALDQVGFRVEDRDRSRGLYFVRYNDPYRDDDEKKGLLSRIAFWRDDDELEGDTQYQVSLESAEANTRIVILDEDGEREISETAARILTLLQEQLK